MNILKKLIKIPAGETLVEAVELWEVRWTSRNGAYCTSIKPEAEVLTSKQAAEAFAAALKNAFRLLKHTGEGTIVEMSKKQ